MLFKAPPGLNVTTMTMMIIMMIMIRVMLIMMMMMLIMIMIETKMYHLLPPDVLDEPAPPVLNVMLDQY